MVSVNYKVVGRLLHITILLHIRTTAVGIFLAKAVFQIEIRLVLRLHYGIIDIGILNPYPSYKVAVLSVQLGVFQQHYGFSFSSADGLFFRNNRLQTFIELFLPVRFLAGADNIKSACTEDGRKHRIKNIS